MVIIIGMEELLHALHEREDLGRLAEVLANLVARNERQQFLTFLIMIRIHAIEFSLDDISLFTFAYSCIDYQLLFQHLLFLRSVPSITVLKVFKEDIACFHVVILLNG
jgi:hypothetical protein